MAEADPASKLRTVLDYVPCEACLSQPVAHQELLCSVCRRLDRQVGVRISVATTVITERPSKPEPEPVVIPPPQPAPEPQAPVVPAVEIVSADAPPRPRDAPPAIEVVVEPLVEAPVPVPIPAPAEPEWDDVASFEPAFDDMFEKVPGGEEPRFRREEAFPEEVPDVPRDDFVFQPSPPTDEEPPAPREEEPVEDWMPAEEAPAQPEPREEPSPWAPPEETLVNVPVLSEEEEIVEPTIVEDEPEPEIVEMEVVEDEAAGEEAWRSDLWRLPGFDRDADSALAVANVRELSHLSGHDPNELSSRTSLAADRLAPWIHVADLVQEVGVPLQSALALVAAGIEGPRGLRETDAEAVVERAPDVKLGDVKRWKRRA